jgi:ParB family chromosome partitioning protein
VRDDEAMAAIVESVRTVGVQTPLLVRPTETGRYELVSGHRRKHAAALAGLETLPVIVRELSRDEAIIAMVDANLQREVILPSEKAFSYKMKLEALSRQGSRTDLTSSQVGTKLRTNEKVGQEVGDSREQVRRFIRLTSLVSDLLQMVDDGKIAFRPAVELSYLQENEQTALLEAIEANAATPSLAQAIKMKQFSQQGKLTPEVIQSIMEEEKPNQREKISFSAEKFKSYFKPGTPIEKMEQTILKALELYRQRQRSQDAR